MSIRNGSKRETHRTCARADREYLYILFTDAQALNGGTLVSIPGSDGMRLGARRNNAMRPTREPEMLLSAAALWKRAKRVPLTRASMLARDA